MRAGGNELAEERTLLVFTTPGRNTEFHSLQSCVLP